MLDLTGITNENEFYTHHYLSAILEEDGTRAQYSALSYCSANAECNRMCYIMEMHCIERIA
jgi:hypothetical protein